MSRVLIGCCLMLLTACARKEGISVAHYEYDLNGVVAHEFLLIDGTRCVATSRGGVSCEWHGKAHEMIIRGEL